MTVIIGDVHGQMSRLDCVLDEIAERKKVQEPVYLLVCGDWGIPFSEPEQEIRQLEKLDLRLAEDEVTILLADGNHENFDWLNAQPVTEYHGARVHKLTEHIYHILRGEITDDIDGRSVFFFGGAASKDRWFRESLMDSEGPKTWWPEESPTQDEIAYGWQKLDAAGRAVDLIITHNAPKSIVRMMGHKPLAEDRELTLFLEDVALSMDFEAWYFGHYHEDVILAPRYRCLYYDTEYLEPKAE